MIPKTDRIFYRDPEMKGVEISRVSNSSHAFPKHFHEDLYIISLISSGSCHCLDNGQRDLVTGPGGVTLINPGQVHSGVPLDHQPLSYTVCYISLAAMESLARDSEIYENATPEFMAHTLADPLITALLENLFKTLISSQDRLEKEALIVSAVHFIFSRYGHKRCTAPTFRHHPVTQARELLSLALDQKLTLAEVAQSVGLSQYHFLRTFKRETGVAPHQYRTLKRLEAAKMLLKKRMPPAQVALETGFTDQSHFANTFRRYFGATPRQYLARA